MLGILLLYALPALLSAFPALYAFAMRRQRLATLLLLSGAAFTWVPYYILLRDATRAFEAGEDVPGVIILPFAPWVFAASFAAVGTIIAAFAGQRRFLS